MAQESGNICCLPASERAPCGCSRKPDVNLCMLPARRSCYLVARFPLWTQISRIWKDYFLASRHWCTAPVRIFSCYPTSVDPACVETFVRPSRASKHRVRTPATATASQLRGIRAAVWLREIVPLLPAPNLDHRRRVLFRYDAANGDKRMATHSTGVTSIFCICICIYRYF